MRICLSSTYFPPTVTGGIPRQRQILANALVRLGHEVHVMIQGEKPGIFVRDNVIIHTIPVLPSPIKFSNQFPSIDYQLTHSLGVHECVRTLNTERPIDILDVPLWNLEGFVSIYANEFPTVLWLQTSRAHLVNIENRTPRGDEVGMIDLEKQSLLMAKGVIADSYSVLPNFEELFELPALHERSRAIPLGIPDLLENQRIKHSTKDCIEILLVGRLEKRKGTLNILNVLPDILKIDQRIEVRFIGSDNSQWDGFYDQFKITYPQYFLKGWPDLKSRVHFEGPVSDNELVNAYNRADIMLVPSLYESFGLIYLEAMRSSLPIVTYTLGAAPEIFPRGEEDGALLVSPDDPQKLVNAVASLCEEKIRRENMGRYGRQRFLDQYLDSRMAEETEKYYREIRDSGSDIKPLKIRRIYQVMESLDVGDAVSSITIQNSKLLHDRGMGGTILGLNAHPQLEDKFLPINKFIPNQNAGLIFHYWNYSNLEEFLHEFKGPKAIHFHNITPPQYFQRGSGIYEATRLGYEQLPKIINIFDLLIGDSTFNLEVLKPYLRSPKPGIVIPPFIETEEVLSRPCDHRLLNRLRKDQGVKMLFVGRIARNKRQDRLIELVDILRRTNQKEVWLYLVGSDQSDPGFQIELETLCDRLSCKDRVIFTGKVTEEALNSYYRAADIFICASEHEGFCMPILEAMAFNLPVFAYAAGAVPETMGQSGYLVTKWDPERIVESINGLLENNNSIQEVINKQKINLARYNLLTIGEKLDAVIRFFQTREMDSQQIIQL